MSRDLALTDIVRVVLAEGAGRSPKRDFFHRVYLEAVDLGARYPLVAAAMATRESGWGTKPAPGTQHNFFGVRDLKAPKGVKAYREFSSLRDCVAYFVRNTDDRASGGTIKEVLAHIAGVLKYSPMGRGKSDPPGSRRYEDAVVEVLRGSVVRVNADAPYDRAESDYFNRYRKEIEVLQREMGNDITEPNR
jgi:hypothetical protein